jgi:hypothetical protein
MTADHFATVEIERKYLEDKLNLLIKNIGDIPIANINIMPYGWRKAAKGRTVWRIIEEIISQCLEYQAKSLGFDSVHPAESEVGVYDFRFCYDGNKESYVNIKSAVMGGRTNKDDISKAVGLIDFYHQNPTANLYIATFVISFKPNMKIGLEKCIVFPTAWIPDIYVNPSNNGNLQSSQYKDLRSAIKRTPREFLNCLIKENEIALAKKKAKKK